MIAKLTGILSHIDTDRLILDVNGVGYLVFAAANTLARIGAINSATTLFIETHVREDHIHLYGFLNAEEQAWFRLLQTVQGVGARVALAILTVLPPDKLQLALMAQDKAAVSRADGVGPKLALRIITELKDKAVGVGFATDIMPVNASIATGVAGDAISALVNLGYGRSDAASVVSRIIAQHENVSLNDVIKLGLKELAA